MMDFHQVSKIHSLHQVCCVTSFADLIGEDNKKTRFKRNEFPEKNRLINA